MRIVEKTLYKIICVSREKKEINQRTLKTQINYINVFSDLESKFELKNEERLINIITEMYTVHINITHTNITYITAEHSSAEKCYQVTEII